MITHEIKNRKTLDTFPQPTDYRKLTEEITRLLRGDLSQRQFSELLGFSFNQVGKWESSATHLKWESFVQMAHVLKIPIEKHFQTFFWTFDGEFSIKSSIQTLAKQLRTNTADGENLKNLVDRWLVGVNGPDFSEILRIIDSKPSLLLGWLSLFVNCEQLPSLRFRFDQWQTEIETVMNHPQCVYVNAALELQAYQDLPIHDNQFLIEHAACTLKNVRQILALLLENGAISFDGKKYQSRRLFEFSFSPNPKLRSLTKFSTELAASRYSNTPAQNSAPKPRNVSMSSVRVVPMSAAAAKKVRDLMVQFDNDVRQAIQEDQGPMNNVQVMLFHSFTSDINLTKLN